MLRRHHRQFSSLILSSILTCCAVLALAVLPIAAHAQGATAATAAPAAKVDINNATTAQLENLPGVGAATAKKIIAGRPYTAVGDLAKAGLSARTIQGITPLVIVGTPASPGTSTTPKTPKAAKTGKAAKPSTPSTGSTEPVDLNSATLAQLEALPSVGAATAKKIVAARPYTAVAELSKAGLTAKQMTAITPLVKVGATPATATPATTPAASAATTPTTPTTTTSKPATPGVAQVPPVKGMVWVNLSTKVYHKEGDPYYGNTKNGKFMTEADAIKAGYRLSKTGGGGR